MRGPVTADAIGRQEFAGREGMEEKLVKNMEKMTQCLSCQSYRTEATAEMLEILS